MKRMKIVFLLLSMLTVGAAFAGEDEVCQRISSFAGIDVNERRLEETCRFMLKQQVGPFQKCVTTMDWDGAISQLLCHAYFPEVVSYSNIVSQLDQTVPTLSKELDCRLVKREPTGEGRLKWTLAVNGSDKWAVELCAIELKRQGQLPSRKLATLMLRLRSSESSTRESSIPSRRIVRRLRKGRPRSPAGLFPLQARRDTMPIGFIMPGMNRVS